jgi:Membrane bound O-acyl transferase family
MPRVTAIPAANSEAQNHPISRHEWLEWAPMAVLPAGACIFRSRVPPWQFMWPLSLAIFWGCKWQTWFYARAARTRASLWRNLGYLLLWPGMDASAFLDEVSLGRPGQNEWLAALAKTLAGIALIALATWNLQSVPPLIAGWLGMAGLVLLLHFGTFQILALIWQSAGVNAEPIMRSPLTSTSLGEFWGRRWNMGFRELSHGLVFQPARKRFGPASAALAAFLLSGLIHDFVISFPAQGGYGLPTAYFLLQGMGTLFERSAVGKRLGLGRGKRGWLLVLLVAGGPTFLLFHPPFVRQVILPFLAAIGSLFGWG